MNDSQHPFSHGLPGSMSSVRTPSLASHFLTAYRPGPTRKVPGRKGMSYTEEDWVDEDATSHRGPDD